MSGKGLLYQMDRKSVQTGLTDITGKVTIGATGAVTAFDMPGVATLVRTSTGKYTLTLKSEYAEFVKLDVTFIKTTHAGIFSHQVNAETVAATTKTVILDCFNASGTLTDPASGTLMYLHLVVRTTTAGV
ncbi:MAG: hypothetical protein ACYTFK_13195 [Planctomycetota bacterium]|jgi:hypothetical protein